VIIKSYDLSKFDYKKSQHYLFYGNNLDQINQIIDEKIKRNYLNKVFNYEEDEILKNEKNFFDEILSQSFFDNEKLLIVSRTTDKLHNIAKEIIEREIKDLIIVFVSENLEKKSKIRSLFEKNNKTVCVAFYPDDQRTLSLFINDFFKKFKISVSQEIINKIIERGNGDRYNIKKELSKIENLTISRNKINSDDILKLINTYEKNNISELVDFCLAKKENKINLILNENNFTNEDTILIIRTFLNKVKRLIKIRDHIKNNKNIDIAISTFKPTIFWKDKAIIKEQISRWPDKKIETLLEIINNNELLIKKNYENSMKILTNFIFYTVKI
tara:strand:+ start:186 stop:1172 length:987 start_codon:yes stop_codon:yes gene_type:complete